MCVCVCEKLAVIQFDPLVTHLPRSLSLINGGYSRDPASRLVSRRTYFCCVLDNHGQ
jgi:hypothetical protein